MLLVLVELLQFCQLKVDTMCGLSTLIHIINKIAPCTKHHTVYIYVLLLQYVVAATKLEILVQIVARIVN